MPFDFKKEYKEFYMSPKKPTIVTVPPMKYIVVAQRGTHVSVRTVYRTAMPSDPCLLQIWGVL